MRIVRGLIVSLCVALLALPVAAQSVKLGAHEIDALLSGNTAVGKWDGTPYRQYFDADGSTIFAQEGARSALGKWRIDTERDAYQSIWPGDATWEGWFVMEYAGAYYWVSKSTPPTPFRVEDGQQLVAANGTDRFCKALERFMMPVQGEEAQAAEIPLPASNPPAATCGASLSPSGEVSRHCHWLFDYREERATEAFVQTVDAVTACLETQQTAKADAIVNHPDSYDLRVFETGQGRLSVSLKDKGALQKTALFLRVEHTEQK